MEKYKFESKVEENLIENACKEFNVKQDEIFYKTYEEKGSLLKGKKHIIEFVKLNDVGEYGKNLLEGVLEGFGLKPNIETKVRDGHLKFEIFSDNNSIIIGKKGHILEALQTYIRQAIYNTTDIYPYIMLDVESYKERQKYFLIKDIKRIVREVIRTKTEVKLDPMNSYERKLIHDALSEYKKISTESVGEEPNRYIVIKYKEE